MENINKDQMNKIPVTLHKSVSDVRTLVYRDPTPSSYVLSVAPSETTIKNFTWDLGDESITGVHQPLERAYGKLEVTEGYSAFPINSNEPQPGGVAQPSGNVKTKAKKLDLSTLTRDERIALEIYHAKVADGLGRILTILDTVIDYVEDCKDKSLEYAQAVKELEERKQ